MKAYDFEQLCSAPLVRTRDCLWPEPYKADTPESAWEFCKLCKTWDEPEGKIKLIPDLDYLKRIVVLWHKSKQTGKTLIIEKSRRQVVTWLLCALDVWDAGRRRCNIVEGGKTFNKASDYVWRCWLIYTHLREDHRDWNLPEPEKWGNEKSQHLDKIGLNGSIIEPLNSDGESFRGSGYTRVKLEELSSYLYPETVLAQAKTVTMGQAGTVGGHVVAVCNASYKKAWQDLKKPIDKIPRPLVDKDHPIDEYESVSGYVIRIHFAADPMKTPEWEKETRAEFPGLQWDLEMEMKDAQAPNALWKREWFEREGFRKESCFGIDIYTDPRTGIERRRTWFKRPPEILKLVIALDPTVSDPEMVKSPNKQPDECGIIVAGADEWGNGHILGDFTGVLSPEEWSAITAKLVTLTKADAIVAEKNQGGELVRLVLQTTIGDSVPIELVTAVLGKRARAEPVSALYWQGRMFHHGDLEGLEFEMLGWNPYIPGKLSPGRIDATVWGCYALGLGDLQEFEVNGRWANEKPEREPKGIEMGWREDGLYGPLIDEGEWEGGVPMVEL